MNNVNASMVAAILISSFSMGCTSAAPTIEEQTESEEEKTSESQLRSAPDITVLTPVVKLSDDAEIVIIGSGFRPNQRISLETAVLVPPMEIETVYVLENVEPEPVANEKGSWITTWQLNEEVDDEIIAEGVYPIEAVDAEGQAANILTYTSVAFYDAERPEEEWPSWVKAYVSQLGDFER